MTHYVTVTANLRPCKVCRVPLSLINGRPDPRFVYMFNDRLTPEGVDAASFTPHKPGCPERKGQ